MTYEQEQKLYKLTHEDSDFQDLLQQCAALEPAFLRIRNSLPDEDRNILEEYLCLCEELEFRRTCLALKL